MWRLGRACLCSIAPAMLLCSTVYHLLDLQAAVVTKTVQTRCSRDLPRHACRARHISVNCQGFILRPDTGSCWVAQLQSMCNAGDLRVIVGSCNQRFMLLGRGGTSAAP